MALSAEASMKYCCRCASKQLMELGSDPRLDTQLVIYPGLYCRRVNETYRQLSISSTLT